MQARRRLNSGNSIRALSKFGFSTEKLLFYKTNTRQTLAALIKHDKIQNIIFRQDTLVYLMQSAAPEIEDLVPALADSASNLQEHPVNVVPSVLYPDVAPPEAALVPLVITPDHFANLAEDADLASSAPGLSFYPPPSIMVSPETPSAPVLQPPFVAIHRRVRYRKGLVVPNRELMLPVDGVIANVTRYPSEEDDDPGENDDQDEKQTLPSAPAVPVPLLGPGLLNILLPGTVTLHPKPDLGTASHPPFLLPPM